MNIENYGMPAPFSDTAPADNTYQVQVAAAGNRLYHYLLVSKLATKGIMISLDGVNDHIPLEPLATGYFILMHIPAGFTCLSVKNAVADNNYATLVGSIW